MSVFDEAMHAVHSATGLSKDVARRVVEELNGLGLLAQDVNEGQEYFRQYALRLQQQIEKALPRVDGIPDRIRLGAEPEQIRDDIRAVFAEKQD